MFHFSSLINKTMSFTSHSYLLKFFPCCQQDSGKRSKKGVFQCLLQKEAYFGLAFWKWKHPTPRNCLSSSWGNISVLHKPPLIAQRILEEQLLGQEMCRIKAGMWAGWVKTTKGRDFHAYRIPTAGLCCLCCGCPKPSLSKALSFAAKAIWFSEDSCSGISENDIYKLDFPRLRCGKTSKPLGKWQLKHLNVQNIFE